MARRATGTATTSPANVTLTGRTAYLVRVDNTGNTNKLLVRPTAVLGEDFDTIEPGESEYYNAPAGNNFVFYVKADSDTTGYAITIINGDNEA